MSFHIHHICMLFHLYVFWYGQRGGTCQQMSFHIHHICKVSHQYVFVYEQLGWTFEQMSFHSDHICIFFSSVNFKVAY
jgi:hypothetical protein